jgi:lipoate-protein ligase A
MPQEEPHICPYDYDNDLIHAVQEERKPRWRVCGFSDTVVILGAGSDPHSELHSDACMEDGIPVLRRQGGGCAVVVDPGNVIVSVVLPMKGLANHRQHFDRMSEWLLDGLKRIGYSDVHQEGISDLAIGDKKVAGSCIYSTKDFLYYSATLLVAPRIDLMERYLKHPPREPDYRRGRAHSDFIGMFGHGKGNDETEEFAFALRQALNHAESARFLGADEMADSSRMLQPEGALR